jgi:Tol biopolymer transport system component
MPVERLSAALADRYRIERELGRGGMATVYLAEDLRHKRLVAVKVLKPELAAMLGAERFVQEITTTAALQHPHILPLFDSGEADGFLYYVMPFIDGETLRSKLDRETQLGIDESVRITVAVADALDYAHRHGVVHRDIKPENILLHDGRPMVADFGIALALSAAAGGRMTETGMSLGTPHYMSPEQATADKEITGRSDIYSLGSVLYEMLTGNPPHTGSSAQQIIMKIITEPARPVTELRKSVPAHVALAVSEALEKLPADRFESARAFADALEGRGPVRATVRTAAPAPLTRSWRPLAIGAGVAALACLALAAWALLRPSGKPDSAPVAFAFQSGAAPSDLPEVAISPDGRRIAEAVTDSSATTHLVLRDVGSTVLATIAGTDGGEYPEFSPDGASVAFVAFAKLWKVPVGGGPPTLLADSAMAGSSWGDDGTIVFTRLSAGLWRVPASGGRPERLTELDHGRREFSHWYPQILPGGHAILFNNFSTPIARSRIEVLDLATGHRTVLVEGAIYPRYVAGGHLLFVRDGALFALGFDARKLKVVGAAVPVLDSVASLVTDGLGGFAVARNGTLVYLDASEWRADHRVVWADRTGNETPAITEMGQWAEPRLSPDGRWIAATRISTGRQVWLFDLNRKVLSQLTHTQGVAFDAVWLPDSRSLIYSSETPMYDLHRARIDGTPPDTVLADGYDKLASSVSADGRTVAYSERSHPDRLLYVPVAGGKPTVLQASESDYMNGAFSPDGHWLAYDEVNSNGHGEVYVGALNGPAGRRQVSADGGSQPRWVRGGKEIIYRKGDAVLSVPFDPATGDVGTPALLFRKPDAGRLGGSTVGYDAAPDGSRFLLVVPVDRPGARATTVVINWLDHLGGSRP